MEHNNGYQGPRFAPEMSNCFNNNNAFSSTSYSSSTAFMGSRSGLPNLVPLNQEGIADISLFLQSSDHYFQNGFSGPSASSSTILPPPLMLRPFASASTSTLAGPPDPKTYCIICPGYVPYNLNEVEPKEKVMQRAKWVHHLGSKMNKDAVLPPPAYCTAKNFPLCTSCEEQLQKLVHLGRSRDLLIEQLKKVDQQTDEELDKFRDGARYLNEVKAGRVQSFENDRITPMGYTTFTNLVALGVSKNQGSNNSGAQESSHPWIVQPLPGPSIVNSGTSSSAPLKRRRASATPFVCPAGAAQAVNVEHEQEAAAAAVPPESIRPPPQAGEDVISIRVTNRRNFCDGREVFRVVKNGKEYYKCSVCEFEWDASKRVWTRNQSLTARPYTTPFQIMLLHMTRHHPRPVGPNNRPLPPPPSSRPRRRECSFKCGKTLNNDHYQKHIRTHLLAKRPKAFKQEPDTS
ncbi:unnamed protein product [Orchesella dallaii]|uniref:C2H2-type domain-containing protein n=1 Tax=Orchesella dallaii TaxID=48710 RepID=A0ABP1RJ19_9HEXA